MARPANLEAIIAQEVAPHVRAIDEGGYVPHPFLHSLGREGYFRGQGQFVTETMSSGLELVEKTARVCLTSAFMLWCHLAALIYLQNSQGAYLKRNVLPQLESGEVPGGTGLSNPLKFYAGFEKLRLRARRTRDGYIVSGCLPSVSNLADRSWFGAIAALEGEERQIFCMVSCAQEGLVLKARQHFAGLNGSATYSCHFHDVFIPDDWIVSKDAAQFVQFVRPVFILYQVPLALGLAGACLQSISRRNRTLEKFGGGLQEKVEALRRQFHALRDQAYRLPQNGAIHHHLSDVLRLRRDVVFLALEAANAEMIIRGGSSYVRESETYRRLREAHFLVHLTPTIKHLSRWLSSQRYETYV
ncbi:MAG: acyl-CoA/acyl-ACP dehydrogenase [Hydrogenibacillus schlegelii]|uniref:Acyl-CoA/acyl-ACP dehydrogenase n=1 Tax=Hydrogenibacillus schlegelii TaxID=1484 RepID=A0A947G993_HYDSH|nr:acyl-CoA/acyl-ACP dehydrogenase [Hydrogenibacillus schlegelii]